VSNDNKGNLNALLAAAEESLTGPSNISYYDVSVIIVLYYWIINLKKKKK